MSGKPLRLSQPKASGDTEPRKSDSDAKAKMKVEFIRWFKQGGAIYWAAKKINRSADTIEIWRKEDPDFDLAVLSAYEESTETLKQTAYARALDRTDKGSVLLLMFLIKGRDPSYKDKIDLELTGKGGGPIKTKAVNLANLSTETLEKLARLADGGRTNT